MSGNMMLLAAASSGAWWPVGTAYTFTNTNLTGGTGPSNAALLSAYSGAFFLPYFSSSSGTQTLSTLPAGTYQIDLYGAQGNDPNNNNGVGGLGAQIQAVFVISAGATVNFIIGQRGKKTGGGDSNSQPGGGMTAFWVGAGSTQYAVAGGGGGAINGNDARDYGGSAPLNLTGANGNGNTGGGSPTPLVSSYSMSGAGWLSNAANVSPVTASTVATRPLEGGFGGLFSGAGSEGGFGGGGCQTNSGSNRAGGGGGYTGGNGASDAFGTAGKGGGSYVAGATSSSVISSNAGNGFLIMSRIA